MGLFVCVWCGGGWLGCVKFKSILAGLPLDARTAGRCPGSWLFLFLCELYVVLCFIILQKLRTNIYKKVFLACLTTWAIHTHPQIHRHPQLLHPDAYCSALPLFYDGSTFKQIFFHRTPLPSFPANRKKGLPKKKFKYFLLRCSFHLPVSLKFMANKIGICPKITDFTNFTSIPIKQF